MLHLSPVILRARIVSKSLWFCQNLSFRQNLSFHQGLSFLQSCASVGLLLCVWSTTSLAADPINPEKPLDVIVQTVSIQKVENSIEALGNLRANESTQLTAKVAKTITQISFNDGQRVKKGDVLLQMTNSEESALMEEARLTAEEARKQLERTQALSKTGAVSPSLLDQRTREYEAAYAHYLAVQARFNDLIVRAPFSGVIGLRNVSLGGFVSPGQNIAMLNDDEKMKLDFTVPSIFLRNLRTGLDIEAKSHDLSDKIFRGKVISIDNQIDESTRSIKVRALIDNPGHELKQGLLMTVNLQSDPREAALASEAALVPMGSNNFVYILRKPTDDEKKSEEKKAIEWFAEKRQVQIGERFPGYVEIISGLKAGDKIVTHGLQKIHTGQGLRILSEQNSNAQEKPPALSTMLDKKNLELDKKNSELDKKNPADNKNAAKKSEGH